MSNIITAIIEENILKKISKNKITENKNILYKEAILDVLKKNKKIDTIIISEKIPGEINFIKLIKLIKNTNKKIKIIIILYNQKLEKELIKNRINDIYYNHIISINKLIKKLKENKKENKFIKNNNFKINKKNHLIGQKTNDKKINNLFNNKINNYLFIKVIIEIINKIKNNLIIKKINNNNLMQKEKNKNNVICIFGSNIIDKKILELIIIKKLLIKNKKIIKVNLKINHKKIKRLKNKKIIKINKTIDKLYLKFKINYQLKEKIINKNIIEIININNILKRQNKLIKIKILKNLIKKYSNNKYYIIINVFYINKKIPIKKLHIKNKNINIIVAENNQNNLLKLNQNKNDKISLIVINYKNNNLSKYFYKIILKNKFNKIKIINI